jgi:predicted dehydrogenase
MAAPVIPPIRLGLIGTGLAVEKLHWPALRGLADRFAVTAFTDSSAEQGRRFAGYSGTDPARAVAGRAARPAKTWTPC